MARIGWDPTATKRTMRESTIAVFNEADTSKDGALQWPEFVNAASIMLKSKNMEDLVDSLEEFIKHEFDSHDVDESLSLDHVRSSRPRRSLIRASMARPRIPGRRMSLAHGTTAFMTGSGSEGYCATTTSRLTRHTS